MLLTDVLSQERSSLLVPNHLVSLRWAQCWSANSLQRCTGCPYILKIPRYILNRLIYQYYTSTKAIIILSDKNVSPYFEKGLKRDPFNVFNSNPYPVAYYWTALLARKIMMLRRGFYDIPVKNVGLIKCDQLSSFDRL